MHRVTHACKAARRVRAEPGLHAGYAEYSVPASCAYVRGEGCLATYQCTCGRTARKQYRHVRQQTVEIDMRVQRT